MSWMLPRWIIRCAQRLVRAREFGWFAENLTLIYLIGYRGIYKLRSAIKYFSDLSKLPKVPGTVRAIASSYETYLWIGFAISVGKAVSAFIFSWAEGNVRPGTPEFAEKLAYEISQIVVSAIQLVVTLVALSFGVASIVLGVFALIAIADVIAAVICASVQIKPGSAVDQWVCGGLTGALIKAITYVIHDYTPLVDLGHSGRLDMTMETPAVTMAANASATGFAVNNSLNLTANITSTLYFGHPNWLGYAFANPQLRDDNLDDSTFKYELQESQDDIDLELNNTTWENIAEDHIFDENEVPSGPRLRGQFTATGTPCHARGRGQYRARKSTCPRGSPCMRRTAGWLSLLLPAA